MKKLVIKLLMLLILINFSSCSTRKLNKQKFEISSSAQSEIRMQDFRNDKLEAKRKILMTDTANEQYSVIIFPSDTFSFSAQHGFKGKAERIELSGKVRRVINRIDSSVLRAEKQSGRTYEEQEQSEKWELLKTVVFKRKNWRLVGVIIGLGVIVGIGWLIWRFK